MVKRENAIQDLGFTENLSKYRTENNLETFGIGRVILEHKERYVVLTELGELDCELIGNLRYSAQSRADYPAAGDWVAVNAYDNGKGLIYALYPRTNSLERQAIGKNGEKQIIASNIDFGLIVQAVNRDYSLNRLERYIALCHSASIQPVVILNKTDLIEKNQLEDIIHEVQSRLTDVLLIPLSNASGDGLEQVKELIQHGKTYCLLGSSGVGKSTLINRLTGEEVMKTGEISEAIDRGKHVTTHRELILLDTGGVIIDNPGMREVGITENSEGLEMTFEQIYALAEHCRFNNCTHQHEKGCAVLEALDSGELSEAMYENFMKLEREQAHFAATVQEKRKKDRAFGKMVKQVMQEKRRSKG